MKDNNREKSFAAPPFLVALLGPLAFAVLRFGQEYANRRELAKADRVGAGTHARPGLYVFNKGEIVIGRNVEFGPQVDLVCYPGGRIEIGDDVFIGGQCAIVSERASIVIGRDCLIAEGVSLRASNHGMKRGRPMRLQPNDAQDIRIGDDVWLGKGATVCAGAVVADGCVVGANSVALGETQPYGIYVGSPIRRVKERSE